MTNDQIEAPGVRPLEWRTVGDNWQADTSIGWYVARQGDEPDFAVDLFLSAHPMRSFATLDEAKAAAQADYERRIRSALLPSSPDQVKRETIEACARVVDPPEPRGDWAASSFETELRNVRLNLAAAIRSLNQGK